jgi:uncharacterized protein (DUF2164 family)
VVFVGIKLKIMSKDPAVLFYTSDFITGTLTMTDSQRGKYIILLCLQHQQGYLTQEDMMNICKTYDEKIFSKFTKDNLGYWYNERMKFESDKRKKYSESRSKNRNISKTYDKHMENENENIIKLDKGVKFQKPSLIEIKQYCNDRKNNVDSNKWFDFYESKGWMIGKNKMKDWKAAIRTWEKTNEPEIKKPQSITVSNGQNFK